MNFEPLKIPGCFKITHRVLSDERGDFIKTFLASEFLQHGLCADYKEEYFSRSKKGVIRGMHFQTPPFDYVKLVSCREGRVLDVLLDIRVGSPTFGSFETLELNGEEIVSVYLPVGIAHGFLALTESALVAYKVSCEYSPSHDCGIRWDSFNADWGVRNPILSKRDSAFPMFSDFSSPFRFERE